MCFINVVTNQETYNRKPQLSLYYVSCNQRLFKSSFLSPKYFVFLQNPKFPGSWVEATVSTDHCVSVGSWTGAGLSWDIRPGHCGLSGQTLALHWPALATSLAHQRHKHRHSRATLLYILSCGEKPSCAANKCPERGWQWPREAWQRPSSDVSVIHHECLFCSSGKMSFSEESNLE